jgi:cytochrome c-type biogenesis protein CcmH/NrfF
MKRKRILQLTGLALLIMLFMGADTNQRFDKLGHRMMCQCGCNQVLLECNHVGCTVSDKMRSELQVALTKSGGSDSDDLVLQGFVQKYGPVVLAAPTASGFDRVAWIVPYVALVLGLGLVSVIIKKWKARQQPASVTASSMTTEQLDEFRRRARQETEV